MCKPFKFACLLMSASISGQFGSCPSLGSLGARTVLVDPADVADGWDHDVWISPGAAASPDGDRNGGLVL